MRSVRAVVEVVIHLVLEAMTSRWFLACTLALAGASVLTAQPSAVAPPLDRQAESATAVSTVPPPETVIGWTPCADYKLATYEQIATYLRALDAASDRMQLIDIGRTVEGRPQLLAIVSSEANLRNLSRYKDLSRRLAQARGLHRRRCARAGARGQGGRLDRLRSTFERGCARADRAADGVQGGVRGQRGNAAHP